MMTIIARLLCYFHLISSVLGGLDKFSGLEYLLDSDVFIKYVDSVQSQQMKDLKASEPKSIGPQPSVQTNSGLIYGINGERGKIFYGIPYAEPPIGNLRFQNPLPYNHAEAKHNKTYQDVLMCYQLGNFLNRDENCLILDIFVPSHIDLSDSENPPADRVPVIFSIHGGAFILGSGTWKVYDGQYLSEATNTIVVSINYRLGPFGFLLYDDGETKVDGNQGFKDQQLALKWVQENIEKFGGDKNQVTIMGESAGAQSVTLHLVSEISNPLFHRAIMQSNTWPNDYLTRESAVNDTAMVVEFLRCGAIDTRVNRTCCRRIDSNFECLMNADAQQLINAMVRVMGHKLTRQLSLIDAVEPFKPYIDGVEFEKQPLQLFKEGKWQKHKPIISGTNEEELIILKYIFGPIIRNENMYRGLNEAIYADIGEDVGNRISDKYIQTYGPNIEDWAWLFSQQMTDVFFGCSMRALARYASLTTESTVHWYQYHHYLDGPDCEQRFGALCGHSSHAFDLHFVYRTLNHTGFVQKEPNDTIVMNEFSTYFGSFALSGDPNGGLDNPLPGNYPTWPIYQRNVEQGSPGPWVNVRISPTPRLESEYRKDVCDFLDTTGVYMDPVSIPETTLAPLTERPTTQTPTIETTSRAVATNFPSLINFFLVVFVNEVIRRL